MKSTTRKGSKYTGVYVQKSSGRKTWVAKYYFEDEDGERRQVIISSQPFTDEGERRAAIEYDKKMISLGKSPVNILKPIIRQ